MEILNISIAAGETKRFEKAAGYFELLTCDYPVSLFFSGSAGNRVDDAQGVVSGIFGIVRFKAFEIFSATAQTIQLLLNDGNGGSRRQPGNVAIIDAVMPICQTATTQNLTIGFTANPIVLPAANVNGVILRACIVAAQTSGAGVSNARLAAAMVAPVSSVPGTSSAILGNAFSASSTVLDTYQNYESRRRLPPGWGLYLLANNTGVVASSCVAVVSFEIA